MDEHRTTADAAAPAGISTTGDNAATNDAATDGNLSVFSRCNITPWRLASTEFQNDPHPLEITGARDTDRRLFALLDATDDADERGWIFHDYVSVKFRLHEWTEHDGGARASLRHSYISLLQGWAADSNSRAGAVLKGWVESRFGLRATFHNGRLAGTDEAARAARERYWFDRMRGAERMFGVFAQLDLLHTFCQDELRRRFPGERWRTLYRGTHDAEEYETGAEKGGAGVGNGGSEVVLFNNLSSFTSDCEVAWEFGSRVWETRAPLAKVVCFSGLLPRRLLGGEAEWLMLGGEYRVKPLLYC